MNVIIKVVTLPQQLAVTLYHSGVGYSPSLCIIIILLVLCIKNVTVFTFSTGQSVTTVTVLALAIIATVNAGSTDIVHYNNMDHYKL